MASTIEPLRTIAATLALIGTLSIAPRAAGQLLYTGVNLAGAEFGVSPTRPLPGAYNSDYTYPTAAEIDYFTGKGVNTIRLPFRWERLQRTQFAPFHATEQSRLDGFISAATSRGAHVVLDPHNFARYYPDVASYQTSSQGLIGSAAVPNAAFADFWSRLAERYKDNDRVIFNLMNEPNSMPTEQWLAAANDAIAAIRAAGANNLVLVPGNGWTGAWTWHQNWYGTPNATAMLNIVDPAGNFAYDVHQYLDHNGSGTSSQIGTNSNPNNVNIGVERLAAFTEWLKTHGRRAFLGEFAVANSRIGDGTNADGPQIGDETLRNMLDHIHANSDVWLGWAWWAAGPWWGNYLFTLEPTNLGQPNQADRPAMAVLQPYFAPFTPGDFNRDGSVDAADYTLWRQDLGQQYVPADYAVWRANFGRTAAQASASTAVPEPAAKLLWLTIVAALASRNGHARTPRRSHA